MAAEMRSEAALPEDRMLKGKIKGPTDVEPSPFICDARSAKKTPDPHHRVSGSSLIEMESLSERPSLRTAPWKSPIPRA